MWVVSEDDWPMWVMSDPGDLGAWWEIHVELDASGDEYQASHSNSELVLFCRLAELWEASSCSRRNAILRL